ncbi:replication protein [Klebsiella pneumoniae]|nr:replication protein [Klebsiella pneumoniae]
MSNTAEIINFPHRTEQPGGRMADLSNGYTKVANEIQQLKPRLRMSGREWQCFEAVIWLTYGWNKKQDRVTNTVIAELTGLSDSHVSDALKSLAERKIIFSQKQGVMKTVGINTDLSAWVLDKPKTGKVFPKSGKVLPKTGKTFPETVDTQDYNKNNIKYPRLGILTNPETRKLKSFSLVIQKLPPGYTLRQVNHGDPLTTSRPLAGFTTGFSPSMHRYPNPTGLNGQIPSG